MDGLSDFSILCLTVCYPVSHIREAFATYLKPLDTVAAALSC